MVTLSPKEEGAIEWQAKEIDRLRAALAEAEVRANNWKFTAEQWQANNRELVAALAEANQTGGDDE